MLLSLAVATVVVTSVYFMHGPGLVLTRINQTERITVECKAGPPTAPTSSESSKPSPGELILLAICVCAVWLGFLKFMTAFDLVERMEKLEARLEQQGKHDAATRETIMKLLGSSLQ
jgi:hypothetical protein